jgi:hypothetical protein
VKYSIYCYEFWIRNEEHIEKKVERMNRNKIFQMFIVKIDMKNNFIIIIIYRNIVNKIKRE